MPVESTAALGSQVLEGGVKVKELNMNQDPRDIAKDYQTKVKERDGSTDLCNIPREHMEPNREAERMVSKGRMNPKTGHEIPLTAKARAVVTNQCLPSDAYLSRYDLVRWDK